VNPYLLDLPAVVSFSGGRTSGFMLRKILDAHGGQPADLKVCFQNTGLEHQATLRFVAEVAERWAVRITWLEYVAGPEKHEYQQVDFHSAARAGEPFSALVEKKGFLPSPNNRMCSSNLKMRTMDRYLKTLPGFCEGYTNAIGLRFDEPRRATRLKADNGREDPIAPMYLAGHTETDVLRFWAGQPFDLELPLVGNMAGNCVGCFLKSRGKLELLIEEMPEHFEWWADAEKTSRADLPRFRNDRPSYASMMHTVKTQGRLFPPGEEDTIPCMCTD
jgi:3'-phosphoadenosine 5'-phosphosulfate sulfotransferase (PAPS reductase)/FAD synthetase